MPPTVTTLPHRPVTSARPRPARPDVSTTVAALYPTDVAVSQRLLATTAAGCLIERGHRASVGRYGDHATAEVDEHLDQAAA